jgi:hypothetical protein
MIKTLSPYYINIPFVDPITDETCTSYTLKIYVWDGDKDTPPATTSYSITKNNPTGSTGNDKINVARLLNDFIDFAPATGTATSLIDGDNQRWCKVTLTYTTLVDDIATLGTEQDYLTDLVIKGYSYAMERENATINSNRILMSGVEFKVNRTGAFNAPIKILEPTTSAYYFTGLYPESPEFSGGDVFYLDAFGVTQVSTAIFSTECRLITALEITTTDSVIPCTP